MPMERIAMRQVRDCRRLKHAGMAAREIAHRVGVAPSTVRLTLRRCVAAACLAGGGRCDRHDPGKGSSPTQASNLGTAVPQSRTLKACIAI